MPCSGAECQTKVAILFLSCQSTSKLRVCECNCFFLFNITTAHNRKGTTLSETSLTLSSAYTSFLFPLNHPDPPLRKIFCSCQKRKRARSDSLPTSSRPMAINSEDVPNPLARRRVNKNEIDFSAKQVISRKRSYGPHPKVISEVISRLFQKHYEII